MQVPINVKFPNNISKWQMGFNSEFKGLNDVTCWTTRESGVLFVVRVAVTLFPYMAGPGLEPNLPCIQWASRERLIWPCCLPYLRPFPRLMRVGMHQFSVRLHGVVFLIKHSQNSQIYLGFSFNAVSGFPFTVTPRWLLSSGWSVQIRAENNPVFPGVIRSIIRTTQGKPEGIRTEKRMA
jgi:hypothetical protein